jgi:hypothetical protein
MNLTTKPFRIKRSEASCNDLLSVKPGDDYNNRKDWSELLQENGYQVKKCDQSLGESYVTRPGKEAGTSATLNYEDTDKLYVFSTSIPELEAGRSYSKFEFLTMMKFGGDFTAAARWLAKEGYGKMLPLKKPKQQELLSAR